MKLRLKLVDGKYCITGLIFAMTERAEMNQKARSESHNSFWDNYNMALDWCRWQNGKRKLA